MKKLLPILLSIMMAVTMLCTTSINNPTEVEASSKSYVTGKVNAYVKAGSYYYKMTKDGIYRAKSVKGKSAKRIVKFDTKYNHFNTTSEFGSGGFVCNGTYIYYAVSTDKTKGTIYRVKTTGKSNTLIRKCAHHIMVGYCYDTQLIYYSETSDTTWEHWDWSEYIKDDTTLYSDLYAPMYQIDVTSSTTAKNYTPVVQSSGGNCVHYIRSTSGGSLIQLDFDGYGPWDADIMDVEKMKVYDLLTKQYYTEYHYDPTLKDDGAYAYSDNQIPYVKTSRLCDDELGKSANAYVYSKYLKNHLSSSFDSNLTNYREIYVIKGGTKGAKLAGVINLKKVTSVTDTCIKYVDTNGVSQTLNY